MMRLMAECTAGDNTSAVLIAEQLDTIAKSTDFMIACEPDTPRASAFDPRPTNSSQIEPPSPIYPNSATSSNLYSVVTPAGQLTARTNDSPFSATPHPTGPSTGGGTRTGTAAPDVSGATVFESALAKEEQFEQLGYYPESPPVQPATGVTDPGRERWLMLTTEFDTPQGLAGTPTGPFSRHSYGDGSSTASLPLSSAHESSRARSAQFAHFAPSPSQRASSASFMARKPHGTGPRSAGTGPRSGPGSYNDMVLLQQLRDDLQTTGTPTANVDVNSRSLALSPRSPRTRMGLAVNAHADMHVRGHSGAMGSAVGARQLSTIDGTSGSVPGHSDRTETPSQSIPISTEDPASRQVRLLIHSLCFKVVPALVDMPSSAPVFIIVPDCVTGCKLSSAQLEKTHAT